MQESELFLLLARLIATIGRIVVLAGSPRNSQELRLVGALLRVMCHGMDAIEKALREPKGGML